MKITFIIGGAKSGKSSFALKEAGKVDGQKAFIATAEALDEEMKERIEKHKIERGGDWDTYEEQISVSDLLLDINGKYASVLLDCLTIWLSNILLRAEIGGPGQASPEESILTLIETLVRLKGRSGPHIVIVSNEVGTGIVPENKLARQFRDLAGILNQKIAEIADEVYLVCAGISINIKSS